jgi:hypothetical protein
LSFRTVENWDAAVTHFRYALEAYKAGKPRNLIEKDAGFIIIANIFKTIKLSDEAKFEEAARRELESGVYKDLEDELAVVAATKVPDLAPILSKH